MFIRLMGRNAPYTMLMLDKVYMSEYTVQIRMRKYTSVAGTTTVNREIVIVKNFRQHPKTVKIKSAKFSKNEQ